MKLGTQEGDKCMVVSFPARGMGAYRKNKRYFATATVWITQSERQSGASRMVPPHSLVYFLLVY
jgi:hypothetical protein